MKKVEFSLSIKGSNKVNEDIATSYLNYHYVIDGATGVFFTKYFDEDSDCAYVGNLLNENIKKCIDDSLDLKTIIFNAVQMTYASLNISNVPFYQLPSFAIAMIRLHEDYFDYYVLGDCIIVLENETVIEDTRLASFSLTNQKLLQNQKDADRYTILQNRRKLMNVENGYPILNLDANSSFNGMTGNYPLSDRRLIIMSDGLDFYLKDKNILDLTFSKGNVNQMINMTYNLENERLVSNLKKRDDISIIALK